MSNEQNKQKNSADVTPESLMERFHGPSFAKVVMVTVVFHVVVIFGTSISYMKKSLFGDNVGKLTKEKRIEKAVADATSSIRKIAEENDLNPQDISDKFAAAGTRAARVSAPAPETKTPTGDAVKAPAGDTAKAPEKPDSKIEKDLKKAVEGPKLPGAGDKDDIFQ